MEEEGSLIDIMQPTQFIYFVNQLYPCIYGPETSRANKSGAIQRHVPGGEEDSGSDAERRGASDRARAA